MADAQLKKAGLKRSSGSSKSHNGSSGKKAKKVVPPPPPPPLLQEESPTKDMMDDLVQIMEREGEQADMFMPYNEEVVSDEEPTQEAPGIEESGEKEDEETTFELHLSHDTYVVIGAK